MCRYRGYKILVKVCVPEAKTKNFSAIQVAHYGNREVEFRLQESKAFRVLTAFTFACNAITIKQSMCDLTGTKWFLTEILFAIINYEASQFLSFDNLRDSAE